MFHLREQVLATQDISNQRRIALTRKDCAVGRHGEPDASDQWRSVNPMTTADFGLLPAAPSPYRSARRSQGPPVARPVRRHH
jgi:hypothetical protein